MNSLAHETTAGVTRMEHQILEHVKQALRVTLDWQAPVVSLPRKLSSVRFTFHSFQRHLERLMEIEEEGGYMRVVAESTPNLQHRIERLAGDHARFRQRARAIEPMIDSVSEFDERRFQEVCREIRSLLAEVDEHDSQEIELLQDALLWDEGGEG